MHVSHRLSNGSVQTEPCSPLRTKITHEGRAAQWHIHQQHPIAYQTSLQGFNLLRLLLVHADLPIVQQLLLVKLSLFKNIEIDQRFGHALNN